MDRSSPASQVLRVRYSKTGKAKYISHLDLMTVMQRAFIRAGVSLKYSEGFNPHPRISVALPASVGVESLCELMDVSLAGSGISEKVNDFLPDGLKVLRVYRAFRGFKDIKWVDVQCTLCYNAACSQDVVKALAGRFSEDSLPISKKTKRGISVIDVAPHIRDVSVSCSGSSCVELKARISAHSPTISHKDIALIIETGGIGGEKPGKIRMPDSINLKRIDIYDENMILFK